MTDLWYEAEGQGSDVMLLHSAITDSRSWEPILASIRWGHRVISHLLDMTNRSHEGVAIDLRVLAQERDCLGRSPGWARSAYRQCQSGSRYPARAGMSESLCTKVSVSVSAAASSRRPVSSCE
jgi:hypothetical protein